MTDLIVESEGVEARARFVLALAKDIQEKGILPAAEIVLRGKRVTLACHAYFALNEAFKTWRIEPGHRTEVPKIAALLSLAIMKLEPFRTINDQDAQNMAQAKPNELFSIYVASSILGISITDVTKRDFQLRLLDILSACDLESLEPIIQDINMEIVKSCGEYSLNIVEADRLTINCLINIFELLADKHTPPAS